MFTESKRRFSQYFLERFLLEFYNRFLLEFLQNALLSMEFSGIYRNMSSEVSQKKKIILNVVDEFPKKFLPQFLLEFLKVIYMNFLRRLLYMFLLLFCHVFFQTIWKQMLQKYCQIFPVVYLQYFSKICLEISQENLLGISSEITRNVPSKHGIWYTFVKIPSGLAF